MRSSRFVLVAVLLAASARAEAPKEAPAPAEASGPAAGPVETLYRKADYVTAIAKADELRAASGEKHVADADSEYWAAKSELALDHDEAGRARMELVMRTYPASPHAIDAKIDVAAIGLDVPRGHVASHEAREQAALIAGNLEKLAVTLKDDPPNAAHALVYAGHGWRIAEDDAMARRDYEAAAALGTGKYPERARFMLGLLAARALDPTRARAFMAACVDSTKGGQRYECGKELRRWAVVGSPAPPLTAETWISGDPVDVAASKGTVTFLWFFATWCPHCQQAMPDMAAMLERLKGKPFRIVGITNNIQGQTTDSARTFVHDPQWKITYPVAVDKDGKTTADYHARSVPAAILIDKKGTIRWAGHPGYVSDAVVDALVAE